MYRSCLTKFKGVIRMALVSCKECHYQVASSANKCPNCGVSSPGFRHKNAVIVIAVVIFTVLFFVQCSNGRTTYEDTISSIYFEQNAIIWQNASYNEKLKFCKNIIEAAWRKSLLVNQYQEDINLVNALPKELLKELDAAFAPMSSSEDNSRKFTNQLIGETATLLMTANGWLK